LYSHLHGWQTTQWQLIKICHSYSRRKTEVEFAAITVMSFIIIIEQMRDHNH